MIQVAIVDDHSLLVEGLIASIHQSGIAVVKGHAFNAADCLNNIVFWNPEVILLDVSLPDMSGIELCKQLHDLYPGLQIIALTTHSEFSVVKQMLDNGARGYLLKTALSNEVLEAIQTVAAGGEYLSREVDRMLKLPPHQNIWLTKREKEVLVLIAEGLTNTEIAEKLFLSTETVRSYRKNLLIKLCAKNTAILIKKSLELKLI